MRAYDLEWSDSRSLHHLTDMLKPGLPGAVYWYQTLPSGSVDECCVFSKPQLENRRTDTSLVHVSEEALPVKTCRNHDGLQFIIMATVYNCKICETNILWL